MEWIKFLAFRPIVFAISYTSFFILSEPIAGMMTELEKDRKAVYSLSSWYEDEKNRDKTINVLSIDGGGVRGIIPAKFLAELEEKDPKGVGRPISEIFDLVVGTSTGAILSLGLCTPKPDKSAEIRSAKEMVGKYLDLSEKIFPNTSSWLFYKYKYSEVPLERELQDYFGNRMLSEIPIPIVLTGVGAHYNDLKLFRNYRAMWDINEDFFVKDVARATSAGPTYFPMKEFPSTSIECTSHYYVDGGMAVNNPSLIALSEAYRIFGSERRINLISLGTGKRITTIEPKEHMLIYRADPVITTLFDAQADTSDRILSNLSEMSHVGIKYHRFQVDLEENLMPMDKARNVSVLLSKAEKSFDITGLGYHQYQEIRKDLTEALNIRKY